ncbi:hypothetical protein MMC19_005930 [Ptychographa xylographoides]|nr:hypothetical protein [Ptychographa xylographoides]
MSNIMLGQHGLGLDTRGSGLTIVSFVFTALAIILVLLRGVSRRITRAPLGADDKSIILSLVLAIVMTVVNIESVSYGFGQHANTLSASDLKETLILFWISQILYKMIMAATKMSILFLCHRCFPNPYFQRLLYIVMAVVLAYTFASVTATVFQCDPLPRAWNKAIPGTCIDLKAFWITNAVASIITDLATWAAPAFIILHMRLERSARICLFMVFSLGSLVIIASCIRVVTLPYASIGVDQPYDTLVSTEWTTIEANVGIICACLPMMRAPINRIFPRLLISFTRTPRNLPPRNMSPGTMEGAPDSYEMDEFGERVVNVFADPPDLPDR